MNSMNSMLSNMHRFPASSMPGTNYSSRDHARYTMAGSGASAAGLTGGLKDSRSDHFTSSAAASAAVRRAGLTTGKHPERGLRNFV